MRRQRCHVHERYICVFSTGCLLLIRAHTGREGRSNMPLFTREQITQFGQRLICKSPPHDQPQQDFVSGGVFCCATADLGDLAVWSTCVITRTESSGDAQASAINAAHTHTHTHTCTFNITFAHTHIYKHFCRVYTGCTYSQD